MKGFLQSIGLIKKDIIYKIGSREHAIEFTKELTDNHINYSCVFDEFAGHNGHEVWLIKLLDGNVDEQIASEYCFKTRDF